MEYEVLPLPTVKEATHTLSDCVSAGCGHVTDEEAPHPGQITIFIFLYVWLSTWSSLYYNLRVVLNSTLMKIWAIALLLLRGDRIKTETSSPRFHKLSSALIQGLSTNRDSGWSPGVLRTGPSFHAIQFWSDVPERFGTLAFPVNLFPKTLSMMYSFFSIFNCWALFRIFCQCVSGYHSAQRVALWKES